MEKDIWIEFDSAKQTLIIKDNGVGISKADIPKIFDKRLFWLQRQT